METIQTKNNKLITFSNLLNAGQFVIFNGELFSKGKDGNWMKLENKLMENLYAELKNVNVIHRPEAVLVWQQFIKKNAKFGYEIESVIHNPCSTTCEKFLNAKSSGMGS